MNSEINNWLKWIKIFFLKKNNNKVLYLVDCIINDLSQQRDSKILVLLVGLLEAVSPFFDSGALPFINHF